MSDDEMKTLQKEVSQKKRIATEWASRIHDVVEDQLWSAYGDLPDLARQTVEACEAWAAAKAKLDQAGA